MEKLPNQEGEIPSPEEVENIFSAAKDSGDNVRISNALLILRHILKVISGTHHDIVDTLNKGNHERPSSEWMNEEVLFREFKDSYQNLPEKIKELESLLKGK